VYSFEGIGLILPIQNEMKEPSRFSRINALVMIFILVLFLFLGEMPVLAFGKITNGSITAVLREYYDGFAVTLSNLLLAFACTLSFPIQFYPALEVLERALHEKGSFLRPELNSMSAEMEQKMEIERKTHHEPPKYMEFNPHLPLEDSLSKSIIEINTGTNKLPMYTPRGTYRPEKDNINQSIVDKVFKAVSMSQYECNRTIFRSMLCTSLMIVAVCVPDVALLISLFGSVGSSMLAIVLPPFLYLKLMKSQHQSCPQVLSFWSICFHWMIIVLGTIGMIVGTWQAFYDVFQTLFSY
jgi:proton-coupled amino acid transporter